VGTHGKSRATPPPLSPGPEVGPDAQRDQPLDKRRVGQNGVTQGVKGRPAVIAIFREQMPGLGGQAF